MSETFNRLTILKALEGGFVVVDSGGRDGDYSPALFAGSLDDCLSFIRSKHASAPE